jgi:TonB-linked SusC/RagA family outer membrane protein
MTYSWVRAGRRGVFLGLLALAFAASSALAQGRVTGTVKNANGAALANARVTVLGTNLSATTDASGNYAIDNVPAGTQSLRATVLGFTPATMVNVTIAAGVPFTANFELKEAAVQLEEVVVTALGIEREQRTLSFAAQMVSEDKLSNVPKSNLMSSLQGNVAGVRVTNAGGAFSSARIVVRGASSILGQNQPLIVVDGVPIDNYAASNDGYGGGDYRGYDAGNAAGEINPNNIESMTVLKGPNAAALYGSRASNGAIVITTKKGAGAPGEGGFGITATVGSMFETPLRLPAYQNQYGQGFYGEFDFVDGNFGGLNDGADESWGPKLDGRTSGCVYNAAHTAYDTSVPCHQFFGVGPWQAYPNNVRDFWQTGVLTNVNVAVARASNRGNMRLSVGRTDEKGMYPTNTNQRTDIALAGGSQISSRWSTEASIDYINNSYVDQPKQSYDEADPMQNFIWFGRQVNVLMLKDSIFRNPDDPFTQQILAGNSTLRTDAPVPYSWNYSYHQNPYWSAHVKTTDFERNRGLGHASVTYKLADWLSVTGRAGRDWYQSHFRANYPVNNIDPDPSGGLSDIQDTRSETNSDFLITANRQLVPGLDLSVNAGGNARQNITQSTSADGTILVIPGVYTLQNAAGQTPPVLQTFQKKVNSLYGSASFNYKNWFNVDLTGRNDWSSTLPKNKNSFFYPSVGAAFIFTDALGMSGSFLSYGKFRGSWTRVGNDTDPYRLAAVYGAGTPWGGLPTFTAPNQLPNANLKPEQTTGYEVGADLGLLNNKVTVNATWYQKSTTDQILPVSISSATGFTSAVVNSGDVRNRGLELAATLTPVQSRDFRWTVVANWSKNTNKVLSLYSGVQRIIVGSFWNINVTADSGAAYGNLVGYAWRRDTSQAGSPIVVGSDGLPVRNATQKVLGNYNPDWVGGINNTFTYKGVSLSLGFDGQHGGSVYSVTKWFGDYSGVLAGTLLGRENNWDDMFVVPNAVYANGQPDTTHVLAQDYWHNTFYAQEEGIVDATYLKLRDARLAFELPASFAQHLGFSGASFAIVGHNLALWSKQKIIDPETAQDTGNRQGTENAQLPTARSIGFTLSVRP